MTTTSPLGDVAFMMSRLIGQGFDRHDALHVLMRAVSDIVFAALNEPLTDRTGDMRAALDALGTDGPKASPRRVR